MHEPEAQAADRLCYAAPTPSHLPLTAEQADPAPCTVNRLSVRALATDGHDHEVAVLSVQGEIDIETSPLLQEMLVPVLERETGPVVVDLSEVAFMDSTGVHVLVDTLRRLTPQKRRLAIVCREGDQIHRLLALVGLLDILTVHRSRESAVIGGDDVIPPRLPVPAGRTERNR